MGELYIGLMSGTSLDGADVAIVELDDTNCAVHASDTTPFPEQLSIQLRALAKTPEVSLVELGTLDAALGSFFAGCVQKILVTSGRKASDIVAIGHSGHTVFHKPAQPHPFTMQIGDPNIIAAETGIDVVADFRRMDVAHGGQGAPLVPTFHAWRFADPHEVRVTLNLGGVANITVINPGEPLTGFDTGPANSLLDAWCRRCWDERYDVDGHRARSGEIVPDLLAIFVADPYFERLPPKSTGFEYFNLSWVAEKLAQCDQTITDSDVLTTLTEVTAATVSNSIKASAPEAGRVILCGGGAFNSYLVERLEFHLPASVVESSSAHGVAPEWVEALAFAWLAKKRLEDRPGNATAVTGARHATTLGGIYSVKQHS
jgi:anhydro-N-acetylmuramic acid kinase